MEKISVIIPAYNREKTIERAIRSVLEQTYRELEVVVVDDGSVDQTETVVKSIQDERLRYIKKENGGAGSARNEGVRHATAELIAFHDSDDAWHADKLEKQMAYWQRNPRFGMIYCAYNFYRLSGEVVRVPYRMPGEVLEGDMFRTLLQRNTIGTPTMLMKKQCFEEVGGFDVSLKSLEDWEFALRFSRVYEIGYVDEVLLDAYQGEGSVSCNLSAHYDTRCRLIAKYRSALVKENLFEPVVADLFAKAEELGLLEQVKRLLMMYLQM